MENSSIPASSGDDLFDKILATAVSDLDKLQETVRESAFDKAKANFKKSSSNKIPDMSNELPKERELECESDSEGALKHIWPPEVPRTHILVRCWKDECPADYHYRQNPLHCAWLETKRLNW